MAGAARVATYALLARALAHVCSARQPSAPPWQTVWRRPYSSRSRGDSDAPYCHRAGVPAVKSPLPADTKINEVGRINTPRLPNAVRRCRPVHPLVVSNSPHLGHCGELVTYAMYTRTDQQHSASAQEGAPTMLSAGWG